MKVLRYQQKAVQELVDKSIELLSLAGQRHTLVFEAPTGAGKTIMASEMLMRLCTELTERADAPYSEVAFMWIAPNKLHEQSYFKMKTFFTETRELHPVVYDDMDHSANGYIHPGEILFVNWESINKDNALMIRDTEQSASLYDLTRRTQIEQEIPLIVIIDEEHMFAGKNAKKSEKVLQNIMPKLEIRISATPITANPEEKVKVHRQHVIEEQMIKEGVVINPALDFSSPEMSLTQHLVSLALKKRNELAEAYKRLGVNINPLLLIQLPNDGSESMSADDTSIKDEVILYLDAIHGINTKNNRLAIWLSGEKENVDGLERNDNMTEALLFKQAIALGWDCPRAAVLLIFRKIESFTFGAQTVGRILRMPEQKFYQDDRLNKGYVYTNISQNLVKIEPEDMDYLSTIHTIRRENLCNVSLQSEYCERPAISRKRLGSDFQPLLIKVFEEQLQVNNRQPMLFTEEELFGLDPLPEEDEYAHESQHSKNRRAVMNKIEFRVQSIGVEIIEDLNITGEVGQTLAANKAKYIRTMQELNAAFNVFCARLIGSQFEKVSIPTLGMALKEAMEQLFGLFETDAVKVILYHKNRLRFEDIIRRALNRYFDIVTKRQQERVEKSFVKYDWEVPADRLYKEDNNVVIDNIKNHALMPFVQLRNASSPERMFETYLEQNTEYIDWWYKNGDSGKQHYAVSYVNAAGEKALFYVDFVIRMKNGQVFLFDTKSIGSDGDAPAKHNALIDYMASSENKDKNLKGGVIIADGDNWKYSPLKIDNTTDIVNWDCFYPSDYKN